MSKAAKVTSVFSDWTEEASEGELESSRPGAAEWGDAADERRRDEE